MSNVVVIGAGAAGTVAVKKCLQVPSVFKNIHVASRTLPKCEALKKACNNKISISQCDADNPDEIAKLLDEQKADLVINLALPYQDLSIMEGCLKTNTHYVDTANYEPKDKAEFCYKWQWDYHDRFKEKGLMALLGSGFDPGVTNVFCAYAQQELFDEIDTIDIIDCNDGDHGHPFATNFNPEINIREITQPGKYWKDNQWVHTKPLEISSSIEFPEVGPKTAYLMYHEELESLSQNIKGLKQIRFWMTFSDAYITHLNVLQNIGMTSIKPITYQGQEIIPLQFLKAVLPEPGSLGKNYKGKTSIGCVITGKRNGVTQQKIIYNICSHQDAYNDTGSQAVSYTTGVPAMIGAKMILEKKWFKPGVHNIETLNPIPFLENLNQYGLPWHVTDYEHTI